MRITWSAGWGRGYWSPKTSKSHRPCHTPPDASGAGKSHGPGQVSSIKPAARLMQGLRKGESQMSGGRSPNQSLGAKITCSHDNHTLVRTDSSTKPGSWQFKAPTSFAKDRLKLNRSGREASARGSPHPHVPGRPSCSRPAPAARGEAGRPSARLGLNG